MTARDLALVAVFAALIAVLGAVGLLYPFGAAVPITAQTLGVMLAGSVLGARRGTLAVAVFLALVLAGLPWLAGGRGGLAVLAGPSAGFLLGWLPGAAVVGALVARRPRSGASAGTAGRAGLLAWLLLANAVGGIVVVYTLGVPVLAWRADLPLTGAAAAGAVFLPGDLVKVVVSALVTAAVLRGYPGIVPDAVRRDRVGAD